MNRQALRSVAADDDHQSFTQKASDTISNAADSAVAGATSLAEDGKELAERTYAYASRTVRENPTLALAGVVAVGALAVIALRQRQTGPRRVANNIQRDLVKHTRDIRRIVRQELRDSGATDRFNELGRTLSSLDWKPYVQPFIEQATAVAQQANEKLTGKR